MLMTKDTSISFLICRTSSRQQETAGIPSNVIYGYINFLSIPVLIFIFQNNGKQISWKHLIDLYESDQGKGSGLSMVHKLKYEHLYLTSFSKMRVDLAAQVCYVFHYFKCTFRSLVNQ